MKFNDAVNAEINRLECVQGRLASLTFKTKNLEEEGKIAALNAEIARLKRIIWDEDADMAEKAEAFRLYDSLGFVKEGLKK